jgi:hypothetical protein
MSFKPEVIADPSGKWCGNALCFATREEAEANVRDLMMRWFAVRETRIVVSDDPVNYRFVDGRLENLTSEAAHAGAISFNPARLRVWRGFCFPAAKAERPLSVQSMDLRGAARERAKRADFRRSRERDGTAGVDPDPPFGGSSRNQ